MAGAGSRPLGGVGASGPFLPFQGPFEKERRGRKKGRSPQPAADTETLPVFSYAGGEGKFELPVLYIFPRLFVKHTEQKEKSQAVWFPPLSFVTG